MSGGVGPTYSDISLPKDEDRDSDNHPSKTWSTQQSGPKTTTYLSFRQLNCLALIIILSATGMVSSQDVAFLIFSLLYIYFLSKFVFPVLITAPSAGDPPVFDPKSKLLRAYVSYAAVVGLILPVAYIFEGILEGDKEGIKAATPHVFLLASQVFVEGVASSSRFSNPVRVFVPVIYNAVRIFTLMEWLGNEFSKVNEEYGGNRRRLYVGRGLAIANTAFWSFNLFGFLLPVYLPKAFKRYYSDSKLKD